MCNTVSPPSTENADSLPGPLYITAFGHQRMGGGERREGEKNTAKRIGLQLLGRNKRRQKIRDYCAPAAVILLCAAAFRISWSVPEQKSISQADASVTVLNAAQSTIPSSMHTRNVVDPLYFFFIFFYFNNSTLWPG